MRLELFWEGWNCCGVNGLQDVDDQKLIKTPPPAWGNLHPSEPDCHLSKPHLLSIQALLYVLSLEKWSSRSCTLMSHSWGWRNLHPGKWEIGKDPGLLTSECNSPNSWNITHSQPSQNSAPDDDLTPGSQLSFAGLRSTTMEQTEKASWFVDGVSHFLGIEWTLVDSPCSS